MLTKGCLKLPSFNADVAGPGYGGDCEAAGLDLRQHPGGSGRIRREGELGAGSVLRERESWE